jgi:hypothetical protein
MKCFRPAQPAGNKSPSGARQRRNKDLLLPSRQAAQPAISNDMLVQMMDRYRPEGANV